MSATATFAPAVRGIADELRQLGAVTDLVTRSNLDRIASRLEDAVLAMERADAPAPESLEALQLDRDVLHDRLAVVNEGIRRLGG